MRVLVTGGAGFLGSALVDRMLAEGHAVDVVDDLSTGTLANLSDARSSGGSFSFHQMDVRAAELVALLLRRVPDVVFHLAVRDDGPASLAQPVVDAASTVVGGLGVAEAARAAGVTKLVVAVSAGGLYGAGAPIPTPESPPPVPTTPAGQAVRSLLGYLALYRELHALEYTALALGTVYGPRQRAGHGVVATFADAMVDGRVATLDGDGSDTRDLVHVDDAADALARAATRGGGLVVNVGTGRETSISELYRAMADMAGVPATPAVGPARPGDPKRVCLDVGRAAIQLGWRPFTPLADGVAGVLRWTREQRG